MKTLFSLITLLSIYTFADINVVTTTQDLAYLVGVIGKEHVRVTSISKGTQDPHFIEAKPSFMVKLHNADLIIINGLDLEVGWLNSLLQGARNPKLDQTQKGYLDASTVISPIEIPSKKMSRADGDVHPFGNPHYLLSPENALKVANLLSKRLSELQPEYKKDFESAFKSFEVSLLKKISLWKQRMSKLKYKNVVTYHKTLNYFLNYFSLNAPITLEPKPGIPPTSQHLLKVLDVIKSENIKYILIENFFDPHSAKKLKESIVSLKIFSVPVQVGGEESINTLEDLYEKLVTTLEDRE